MKKDDDSYHRFSSNSNNDYSEVGGDIIFETNIQLESYLSTPVKKS